VKGHEFFLENKGLFVSNKHISGRKIIMTEPTASRCPIQLAKYFRDYIEQIEPWELKGVIREKAKAELAEDVQKAIKENRTPRQRPRYGTHARATLAA
jgi:hypothetical protein